METIDMWSDQEQGVVSWTVATEQSADHTGGFDTFVVLRHNDEWQRFSPNATMKDLEMYAKQLKNEKGI